MATRKMIVGMVVVVLVLMSGTALATQYYVSPDGDDNNSGTSWATAFETIGKGISTASNSDIIDVNEGTYYETINFVGKAIKVRSTDPNDWDVVEATIIDGSDSGSVVVFNSNEGSNSVLRGFTITDGNASYGGGIYCNGTSPIISRCVIRDNYADSNGAGIYSNGASLIVSNCVITDNNSAATGGGIFHEGTAGTISNCMIVDNSAGGSGGGLRAYGLNLSLKNCVFAGNNSGTGGGGMHDNTYNGMVVINCTFSGNETSGDGGGVYITGVADPDITNCIIWGNSASCTGDELAHIEYTVPTISYCDIKDCNGSGDNWDSSLGTDGGGNIDSDPYFEDWDANDFHLSLNSPCIDAGDPNGDYSGQTDIDGQPRVSNGRVDMGADEIMRSIIHNINKDKWYLTINAAIDDANNSNVIVVYEGTYEEAVNFDGKAITLGSTDPNDWDVVEATIIDANNASADAVMFASGEDANTVFRGLTVTGASVGVYVDSVGPVISRCILHGNRTGVQYTQKSTGTLIVNNKIYDSNGYGIFGHKGNATIKSNWIYDSDKGIKLAAGASADIYNNTIVNNISYGIDKGGGGGTATISNCIIWDCNDDLEGCSATYSYISDCNEVGDANITHNSCADPLFLAWVPSYGAVSRWKFDESSGTTAYDSMGYSDGTLVNGPSWTSGLIDGALEFDANDDYVDCNSSFASVTGSSTKSIMAWIKPYSSSAAARLVTLYRLSDSSSAFAIRFSGSPATWSGLYMKSSTSYEWLDSGVSVDVNEWTHVALVQDGTDVVIYINGEAENSASNADVPYLSNPPNAVVGAYMWWGHNPGGVLDGVIDEVLIYESALSSDEIRQLYQYGLAGGEDYHLSTKSPCIDAGDPNGDYSGETDIDGEDRVFEGQVDMGADESHWYLRFGMKVESAKENPSGVVTIVTTGATYVMHSNGVDMYRRIDPNTNNIDNSNNGKGRMVAELSFDPNIGGLSIGASNMRMATVHSDKATFDVYSDSLFFVTAKEDFNSTHTNLINNVPCNAPLDPNDRDSDRMWTDGYGGSLHAKVSGTPNVTDVNTDSTTIRMAVGDEMAHMVFPPKKFDFEGLYGPNSRPHVHFVYSTSAMNNLTEPNAMEPYIEDGFGVFMLWSSTVYDYEPDANPCAPILLKSDIMGYKLKEPNSVNNFVSLAHQNGFKVITYLSWPGGPRWNYPEGHEKEGQHQSIEVTLEWMRDFQEEYDLDGWYFDNANAGGFLDDYDFIRQVRTDVGSEGIIYHHDSVDIWGIYNGCRAIMINAYVNYTLTGETGTIAEVDAPNDPYFRFFTAGYGMSQAYSSHKRRSSMHVAISEEEKQRLIGENLNGSERTRSSAWLSHFKPGYDIRKTAYNDPNINFDPDVDWPIDPNTGWFRTPTNIDVNNITGTSAVITWTTPDINSDSDVAYTADGIWWPPDGNEYDPNMVIDHSISLSGLNANTDYEFRIRSNNGDANIPGEIIWGYVGSFKTLP